ncbi:MAG: tRNA (adenosine(37)-N6)-threonylcarbamoyltransferase complex transferase subunit TsaD [Lachnospiraceae bacterium]|nr:tRNA (adenosine(37)-N6)-threonylcarbamoyltransferase complex transferase subunit TsaD [Lachnospiraceae bacterium]
MDKNVNNNEEVLILAIESSCDETAAAVVKNGREVLSNVISSQIDLHKLYGGVVPEIASRKHIENITGVVDEAVKEADVTMEDIDAICVTYGPGLVGALLVGVAHAKALSYALNKPLVGVNHIEGHISANYIENKELEPPYLAMVVSGGHTHMVMVNDYGEYEIIGRTRDDAAGEAFDKVARAVGLGYPGGPKIDKLAKEGNKHAIDFPRANIEGAPYDFSFSGVKSAVLNYLNVAKMKEEEVFVPDVVASFQNAVVDAIVSKTVAAAKEYKVDKVALAGGVAANSALREGMEQACKENGITLYRPSLGLCTDNAAMIGAAGYYEYIKGTRHGLDLNAIANLKIGER